MYKARINERVGLKLFISMTQRENKYFSTFSAVQFEYCTLNNKTVKRYSVEKYIGNRAHLQELFIREKKYKNIMLLMCDRHT